LVSVVAGKLQSLINSRSGPARRIFRYWTLPIEAVAPQDQIWEDARLDPRKGGREVECQEANRVGRIGAFAALKKIEHAAEESSQTAP